VRDAVTVYSLWGSSRRSHSSSAFTRGDSFSLSAWSNYESMTEHIVCQRSRSSPLPSFALTWTPAGRPGLSDMGNSLTGRPLPFGSASWRTNGRENE
jgi:hypothetical protein